MTERIAIGIDLGGTYIKAGLVTDAGESLGGWKEPTRASSGPGGVMDALLSVTRKILNSRELRQRRENQKSELVGIGIGSPGIIDPHHGVVRKATANLPGWEGTEIGPIFEGEFRLKAHLDNDANAYVWGEYWFGAGRGKTLKTLLGLTLGTGVGGGVVIGGRILHGAHGCGGELGHIVVSEHDDSRICSCGLHGCLESYASASGVVHTAKTLANEYPESLLGKHLTKNELTAELIHQAALKNDALALKTIERTAHYLGRGLAGLVCCFDPDLVVLGGGVANMGALLFDRVQKIVQERVWFSSLVGLQITPARLGGDGGYKGAAALALFPYL